MNQTEKERLIQECTKFRNAIEQCKDNMGEWWYRDFPKGCCGDISEMLINYLVREEFKDLYCIYGTAYREVIEDGEVKERSWSHAWLELDSYIIDITADQFDEINEEVLITDKSIFHEQFEIDSKVPAEDVSLSGLAYAYDVVCNKIKEVEEENKI